METTNKRPAMIAFDIFSVQFTAKGRTRKGRKLDTVFYREGTTVDEVLDAEYRHWLGGPITATKQRTRKGGK
jgi:hypothetical protein